MDESSDTVDLVRRHNLSLSLRLAYSIGHVFNDLCASMWFTYLLLYLHSVLQFNNSLAGILLMIGQIADGLATPFVGFESDRNDNFWLCRYGRRKTWHLVGTLCVLGSFPFLFMKCIGCEFSAQNAQSVYYAAFIVIFQFGWAAVQISHLSLIPDLTTLSSERSELNSLRYAFTVISNILVYTIAWLFLGMEGTDTNDQNSQQDQVGPKDSIRFRNIAFCVIGIGFLFSVLFHFGVKEKPLDPGATEGSLDTSVANQSINSGSYQVSVHLQWKDWFKEIQFYKIGLLYLSTRLYVNLSQTYFPLYLQESLQLNRQTIATVPLVIYLSGFVASFLANFANKKVGHKWTYLVSALIAIGTSAWLYLGQGDLYRFTLIYVVASLVGVAGSSMLITSLCITSDMIGHNTSSGAFVFGAMSFLDKISNGLALFVIQHLHPCLSCCEKCKWYYSIVLSFVCGGAAVLALLALATLALNPLKASTRFILIQRNDEGSRYGIIREYDDCAAINS